MDKNINSNYSGFGPKGYERSDEIIHEDVCEALTNDIWVDASDIEVKVKHGYTYLEGQVPTRQQKKAAEAATERVPGVKDVINHLTLKQDRGLIGDMSIKANMV